MIDHERARELAAQSRDTTLDPTDADWLDDHLAGCDACRAAVAEHDATPGSTSGSSQPARSAGPGRPAPVRHRRLDRRAVREVIRRPAFLATVAALVVALLTAGLAWNAGRPTAATVADAADPSRTASPGASLGDDPWASLEPAATFDPLVGESAAPTALLTASGATGPVVPLDTGFRLASVDATLASALAARLTVQPSFDFSVTPEAGDRVALITPAEPLQPGTVYRFALAAAGGELLDSWAFQARQPLRVVTTVPDNQATDVPVDTGIEIAFDQDGVADAATHVNLEPATRGRFEEHGRTLAFIPDKPLAPATLYKVTVTRGVTVAGTGEATDKDTRFQFETAAKAEAAGTTTFQFQDQLVESATAERPVIGLFWFGEEQAAPKTVKIGVYSLANLDAGIDAFRALRARPDWSRWSKEGLLDAAKLHRVATVDARLNAYRGSFWIQLPEPLPAGWYLVQQSGGTRPIQTVLQVTDVAGYLAVSETRTVVWANDLKTGRPIVGAAVASDGTAIGRTDANGLAQAATPANLLPEPSPPCNHPCEPVVTVRTPDGRAIFLPVASAHDKSEGFGSSFYWFADTDPSYWSLLHTDRNRYRPTDTINVWGILRSRDDGTVPADVVIRLTPQSYDNANVRPAAANVTVKPGAMGAFGGSLPLTGLAEGYYSVELLVGGKVVRTSGIVVGPIAKPAYRLEVETGRRVYIAGDRIKVTIKAGFFEGTPVPGVPLRIGRFIERSVTTDASGTATYRTTARTEPDAEGPLYTAVDVTPARAEEGEIAAASRDFMIFPSSRTIDASTRIANGRVRVSGSVHAVAVDRLEKQIVGGQSPWDLDPRGAAVRGAIVTVRFVEQIPVRRQTGTEYDFIEKRVRPVYETTVIERAGGSIRVRTTAKGTYSASAPAVKGHDYQVTISVGDSAGRVARQTTYANADAFYGYDNPTARLGLTDAPANPTGTFGIGDRVDLTLSDPDTKQAVGDGSRYLFLLAQRGIRGATVQSSPRYVTTFVRWAAPNLEIGAVRFTGRGYVGTVGYSALFRTADRRLKVDLSVGAARYAPGATATVDVRTRTASGAPIAATVILRAVDEKLFSIGAAAQDDPLPELYTAVASGIVGTYGSHRAPRSNTDGGDTGGGGGDRDDFRDSLLFKTIVTDANGRGSVSFPVSDDLTSWRVSASAITARLEVGTGSVLVPVGLPFFVDASIAPEYLVADRPSIAVRAFGSAIGASDGVTIRVTSTSLGYDSGPIRATAFQTTVVPLPALKVGMHSLTISATTGSGAAVRTDRLTRSFSVVETHLTRGRTAYVELPGQGTFSGGGGATSVVVSDGSAGRYLPLLTELAEGGGARLDRGLAAEIASSLLVSHFGSAAGHDDVGSFAASRYQTADGGMALLPYSSSDLELSALVAIIAPDRVDRSRLGSYLRMVRTSVGETRERQTFTLAGLAGVGDPVLPALQAAAADDALTVRERLMIGLGAAALGDEATARSIVTALIAKFGERVGPQARLRVGSSTADITEATALAAVLCAAVGDSRAPLFWAYVEENPIADRLEVLPAAAYLAKTLDRLPVQPASFAYTVNGTRTVVTLERGRSFELSLDASQLASLRIEQLGGSVGVTTSWHEPVQQESFEPDQDVSISRSMKPSTRIASADLVTVELVVTFGPQAASGCRQVTDLVPSGMTPVGSLATWVEPDAEAPVEVDPAVMPYDQSGPRVFFCAEPTAGHRTVKLRYYARVVTPGTYAWEPAVAESRSQDGQAALTAAGEIVIR